MTRTPDDAEDTQRAIQSRIEALDAKAPKDKGDADKAPVQAGAVEQPTDLPAQHIEKPGLEHELQLAPRFMAEHYSGSGKLDGMVAIVTGGDSGIGRAVAVLFAREGADVAVLHLPGEQVDADATVAHVQAEGRRAVSIAGDVKNPAFCRNAVEQVVSEFGRLDVLVNNAAFQQHCDRIEDLTDLHIRETFETNILGYMFMARAAVRHMKTGASIINTGSETGIFGNPKLLDYSSTKGAIHAFTKSLASHLLDRGIRVNCVAPGPVWTPLNPSDKPADQVAEFGQSSDMRRPAQPEEISPAFVFLASPVMSAYVNGIVLPVMGGPRG